MPGPVIGKPQPSDNRIGRPFGHRCKSRKEPCSLERQPCRRDSPGVLGLGRVVAADSRGMDHSAGADGRERMGDAAHSRHTSQFFHLRHVQHRRSLDRRTVRRSDYGGARRPRAFVEYEEQPPNGRADVLQYRSPCPRDVDCGGSVRPARRYPHRHRRRQQRACSDSEARRLWHPCVRSEHRPRRRRDQPRTARIDCRDLAPALCPSCGSPILAACSRPC